MREHFFPWWFVNPVEQKLSGDHNGHSTAAVFSSAEKMAAWLAGRECEHPWQVRILDRDSSAEILRELHVKGYSTIFTDLEPPAKLASIADLVLQLKRA